MSLNSGDFLAQQRAQQEENAGENEYIKKVRNNLGLGPDIPIKIDGNALAIDFTAGAPPRTQAEQEEDS